MPDSNDGYFAGQAIFMEDRSISSDRKTQAYASGKYVTLNI